MAVSGGSVALVRLFGGDVDEVFSGAVAVVVCGLLLRIEQAIRDAGEDG